VLCNIPDSTNLNIVNVVAVPRSAEKLVSKSEDEKIFHHLFAEIMVDTEDLLFSPIRLQRPLQLPGGR
jgi:hypothetical protein